LLPLLFAATASAQFGEKFSLEAEIRPASAAPGQEVTLVLRATVEYGWHAYGTKESVNIPISLPGKSLKLGGLEAVGEPVIPEGTPKQGPLGTSYPLPENFEVTQKLRIPGDAQPGSVKVAGELRYQICDENSCEPPTGAKFSAKLDVVAAAAGQAPTQQAPAEQKPAEQKPAEQDPPLDTAPGLVLVGDEKLTLTARFEPATARAGETVQLLLEATVVDGWHAYGSRETNHIPVTFDASKAELGGLAPVGGADVPPGEFKDFHGLETYPLPHSFVVKQALRVPADAKPGQIAVKGAMGYQVCDENSCDPETTADFAATLTVEAGAARAAAETKPEAAKPEVGTPPAGGDAAKADAPADDEFGGSLWALILACIGGGLFALAMPCTYPMIPITFSFFTKQAEKRGGNVMALALMYGFGIVAMFTFVGAAMSGVIIRVVNHWATNAVIGVFFVFFAFALFGWINLNPPQSLQRLSTKASKTGGLLGVFFMGATLVITSFTCTAPIVGTLLAVSAEHGWQRAAFGMSVFGLTMAIPFVFLALMPTKVKAMPKSGEWMETLKVSLGFVELAAALKFVSMVDFALGWQILPRELFLLIWTAIFGLWALFLFGILRKAGSGPNEGVGGGRMATGMLVTMFAAYFFFGALGNKLDAVLTGFIPGYSNSIVSRVDGGKQKKDGHELVYDNPAEAVRVAQAQDKLLIYNFTGFN
jgi:thiol:disulfide interchange protein DsbD